ncbi:MAG: SOS response-associated peptidase family protein [Cyclobacteriaceae bacterium]|nr:SOS response-associated peptidase family protein [Cyclobacteriaceae bacterium]
MFNRYTITALPSSIELKFNARVPLQYHPNYNAAPGQHLPVILNTRMTEVVLAKWGLGSDKNMPGLKQGFFIRALRTLKKNVDWQSDLLERRCLILADGFYIWKSISRKSRVPYRVISKTDKIICFGGYWEMDEFRDIRFTILTRESYKPVTELASQMPVILPPNMEMRWLNPKRLLDQIIYDTEIEDWALLKYYPVTPKIKNADVNSPSLIKLAPRADQYGNLTLFD